jgi:hypothetical protein
MTRPVPARRANARSDVLQTPEREQQDNYDQYDAKGAARSVTPAARMRPSRQCTDQSENQDDQQYGSKAQLTLPGSCLTGRSVRQAAQPVSPLAYTAAPGPRYLRRAYVRSRTETHKC